MPDNPKINLGAPTFQDKFNNSANWPIYDDEHVKMTIQDGALEMTALKAGKWESWMVTWHSAKDFYLEADVKTGECQGRDRYGVMARAAANASQGYFFGFTCDGKYSLRIWDGKHFTSLIDWTSNPNIHAGNNQENRLGLKMNGSQISMYANGTLLKEMQNDEFEQGTFGVFIGAAETDDFTIQFLEIAYWELP
jgi:hypothetical protein